MWADDIHQNHYRNGGSFTVAPYSRGDLQQPVNTTGFWSTQRPNHSTIDTPSSHIENVAIMNSPSSPNHSSGESSDCDGETVQTADLSCSPSITATHSNDEDSSTADALIETRQSSGDNKILSSQIQKLTDNNRISSNLPRINEKTPATPFLPPLSPSGTASSIHLSSSYAPSSSINTNGNAIPMPLRTDCRRFPLQFSTDPKQWLTTTTPASSPRATTRLKARQAQTSLISNQNQSLKNLPMNRRISELPTQQTHPSISFRHHHHEQHILTRNLQDIDSYNRALTSSSFHRDNISSHHLLYGQNSKRTSHFPQNQSSPYVLQPRQSPQQLTQYGPHPALLSGNYLFPAPDTSSQIRPTIASSQIRYPPQRSPSPPSPGSSAPLVPSPNRSPPEILKTLLRKKACLYEPGTSRAIALITWHVGRNLAFNNGYFSRHDLQSGVHAVVAENIKTKVITRTKVNRCMQIILNSCFHYIIPRPDGSEEKGDTFRSTFAKSAVDDSFLLLSLPPPWHDLKFKFDQFLDNFNLGTSLPDDDHDNIQQETPKKGTKDHLKESHPSKRPVLLCFNENVRSAEDVMRSHNEFIRDTANAADLFLNAEDWLSFYSGEDDDDSHVTEGTADTTLSGGMMHVHSPVPETMTAIGDRSDVPEISFDSGYLPDFLMCGAASTKSSTSKNVDYWGQMNSSELSKFRTTYCCKRYDHDPFRCKFAHVDVNGGWLRRDPMIFQYVDKLCPHIKYLNGGSNKSYQLNTCPKGASCKFAHSFEEVEYHPNRYKKNTCASCSTSPSPCDLKELCPSSHSASHQKFNKNGGGLHTQSLRKHRDSSKLNRSNIPSARNPHSCSVHGVETNLPNGAPMMYINPAPNSNFDEYLMLPGLRDLFRRNCKVHLSQIYGKLNFKPFYSNFEILFPAT